MGRWVIVMLGVSGLAPRAQAHEDPRSLNETDPPGRLDTLWGEVAEPGVHRAHRLLRYSLVLLDDALGRYARRPAQRRVSIENAIRRLHEAHRLAPRNSEVLFTLAYATARWEKREASGLVRRLDDKAEELFLRTRAVDPDYRAASLAFELGVLYTRTHRFETAAAEYQRTLAAVPLLEGDLAALATANLAEVTMLAGHLERAVDAFRRAVALDTGRGSSGALSRWGLAVALDRMGERHAAMEQISDALRASGGTADLLRSPSVFFEPPFEIHWYEALGHEARARTTPSAERESHLRLAQESWRRYLNEGGRPWRWGKLARQRLRAVERKLDRPTPAPAAKLDAP